MSTIKEGRTKRAMLAHDNMMQEQMERIRHSVRNKLRSTIRTMDQFQISYDEAFMKELYGEFEGELCFERATPYKRKR